MMTMMMMTMMMMTMDDDYDDVRWIEAWIDSIMMIVKVYLNTNDSKGILKINKVGRQTYR